MSFTVNDLQDLMRLLAIHPEWLGELRHLVLTNELLSLPDTVRELAEAQRRTEERLEQLAVRVDQLAEAQRRTEERLEQLAVRVDQLTEAQRRTEERLDELAQIVRRLVNQMAEIRGDVLEIKFRDKAPSFFGRWLRRVRVVPMIEIEERLESALSDEEVGELLALDLLVRGRPRETDAKVDELWLAVETSSVIDANDVQRAERRAALLRKAGLRAVPVAAGVAINAQAQRLAESLRVAVMRNGTDQGWERAYSAAVS